METTLQRTPLQSLGGRNSSVRGHPNAISGAGVKLSMKKSPFVVMAERAMTASSGSGSPLLSTAAEQMLLRQLGDLDLPLQPLAKRALYSPPVASEDAGAPVQAASSDDLSLNIHRLEGFLVESERQRDEEEELRQRPQPQPPEVRAGAEGRLEEAGSPATSISASATNAHAPWDESIQEQSRIALAVEQAEARASAEISSIKTKADATVVAAKEHVAGALRQAESIAQSALQVLVQHIRSVGALVPSQHISRVRRPNNESTSAR